MTEVAESYLAERSVSKGYAKDLMRTARKMQAAGVTPLTIRDSLFNRWLLGLKLSAYTRANNRVMGLTLWRHALDLGLTDQSIGRIVTVKRIFPPPVAWSMDELSKLLEHASNLSGSYKQQCPRRAYWRAWILLGYESGLRMTDLHDLRASAIRGNRLWTIAHKTGAPVGKRLTSDCAAAVADLVVRGDGQTVFKWLLCNDRTTINFRKLCDEAGVRGTSKYLRRSGATHVEIAQPGSARAFLGHRSIGLAEKHYIDSTLLPDRTPCPPPIVSRKHSQGRELSASP
jgi:integrase